MDLSSIAELDRNVDLEDEVIGVLEGHDVEFNVDHLIEIVSNHQYTTVDPRTLAYRYLLEIDGSYSEAEARELVWF